MVYPIFDLLGASLGITSEMLDRFFETKDYHELIAEVEEVDEAVNERVEIDKSENLL